MKKIIILSLVLILMSACAVKRSDYKNLEQRVALLEEKQLLFDESAQNSDIHSIHLINQHIHALNTRLNQIEGRGINISEQVVTTPPATNVPPDQLTQLYEQSLRQYHARDFSSAIRGFTSVAASAPQHDLAANSFYWIGECFYAMADYTAARENFQIVTDRYPTSSKFVDAQVKIAMTWLRQNNRAAARTILLAIKRDFPNYERMSLVDQNLRLTQ
jgi:outer membrane protein assembly factor BamD (BamD/ComL family)